MLALENLVSTQPKMKASVVRALSGERICFFVGLYDFLEVLVA